MGWLKNRLPRKKWKRIALYGLGVGVVLLGIDMGWVQYWRRITVSPQTTAIVEPLTAAGTPDYVTALNRRMGQGVTPETNALPQLLKVFGTDRLSPAYRPFLLSELGMKPDATFPAQLMAFSQWARALPTPQRPSDDDITKQDEALPLHPWKRTEHDLWGQWLSQQQPGLAELRAAVQKPRYFVPWFPPQTKVHGFVGDYHDGNTPLLNSMSILASVRMLAEVLRADALRCAGEEDWPGFRADVLAIYRLGRLVSQGPSLIEVLVAVSADATASRTIFATLASTPIPAEETQRLLTDMNTLRPMGSLSSCCDVLERWLALDDCAYAAQIGIAQWRAENLKVGAASFSPMTEEPSLGLSWHMAAWTVPVNFNQCLRQVNMAFDRMTAAASIPVYRDRIRAVKELVDAYSFKDAQALDLLWRPSRVLLANEFTSYDRALILRQRAQATFDMSRIGLAMNRYAISHGTYPPSLDDLQHEPFLTPFPTDDFTGTAYVYRPDGKGYVLHTPGDENQSETDKSLERWGVLRVNR